MEFKVVPFVAKITQNQTTSAVAEQLQALISEHSAVGGWEYVRMESVDTFVAPDAGCFGIGGKPGYNTSFSMVVFKK